MVDFVSALYLGLGHPSAQLAPWLSLTTGMPAVLGETAEATVLGDALVKLAGCRKGLLFPSTHHLFWDLIPLLSRRNAVVHFDRALYPIARWGVERAASLGIPTQGFGHLSPQLLENHLQRWDRMERSPVVVTDGYCPGCGKPAPLDEYLALVRPRGGLLVVDDTQAFGILGQNSIAAPYGLGGGGMLKWSGISGQKEVVWAASLAKAFGVPLTVVGGMESRIEAVARESETRVHCSQASAATIHAGWHALDMNRRCGDALRQSVAAHVTSFRGQLARIGLRATGGLFPVQLLELPQELSAQVVHQWLSAQGIETVLQLPRCRGMPVLTVVFNARHTEDEITQLVAKLRQALVLQSARRRLPNSIRPISYREGADVLPI